MKHINRKKLVISLIKDDLINSKLVYSLNHLGLEADHFNLHASTTIINLMRIKTDHIRLDNIHEDYLDRTKKVIPIDIHHSPDLLDALSVEIYDYLTEQKLLEQKNYRHG